MENNISVFNENKPTTPPTAPSEFNLKTDLPTYDQIVKSQSEKIWQS